MSSKTPRAPGLAGALDQNTVSEIAKFALERGGKFTFTILLIAPSAKMFLAFLHHDLDAGLTALFWWSVIAAWASLFWSSKRNRDMLATGVAEIKTDLPGPTSPSADPGIDRVQQKIEAGVPHGGNTA